MSRSLRSLASAALAVVLLMTAACSQRRSTVLVAWHVLDGVREQALLRLIDRYNATNTDGNFIVPERKTLAAQHTALLTSRTGAVLPAVMLVQPMQAAIYHQQSLLTPLDRLIADPSSGWSATDTGDLYPFMLQAGRTAQGKIIGVPMGGRTRILFYNQDRLTQLGVASVDATSVDATGVGATGADVTRKFTWQSFADVCGQVTDRARGNFCFSLPVDYQTLADWALSNGGRMISADYTQLQVSDARTIAAMTQILTYLQTGQAYPSPSTAEARQQLALGQSTFAFGWTDEIPAYEEAIRSGENFAWSVAALPQASLELSASAALEAGAVAFEAPLWVVPNSNDAQAAAAWTFIKWLLAEPQTAEWALATGELPARHSAALQLAAVPGSETNAAAHAAFTTAVSVTAPMAQPLPLAGGWRCAEEAITTGLREIFANRPITETLQNVQISAQPQLVLDCTLR